MSLDNNRLIKAFAELRQAGKKTLAPFLTAGYPDLDTTIALLKDFEGRGVKVCELGIPFSDPVADGPVIQASYTQTLNKGLHVSQVFQAIRQYRADGGKLALVSMVSYSIVYRHGVESYLAQAAEAGFDGLIIPDLPLEEAAELEPQAARLGLANVLLIAPTTPPARRIEIAHHSRGFIYYVSIAGITGERDALPPETVEGVRELRRHTDTPICVGFGISNAATVGNICQVADGAIVGSAIVRRITELKDQPREQLVAGVGKTVSELIAPVL